ncbi:MAG TPA: hypothetical protein DEB06_06955 [Phycisphaerales bacterium]|nr:hypothetical protein [Phycisphaerales bacterium]
MSRVSPPERQAVVLWCVAVGVTLALGGVLARVAQLQLRPGERLSAHIQDRISRRGQLAPRGDLLDRRGRVLAASRVGHRLFVDPKELKEPFGDTLAPIAEATGWEVDAVAQRILDRVQRSRDREAEGLDPLRYVSVGPVLNDEQVELARRIDLPGVYLEVRPVRELTGGDSIASIVGKVGVDHTGLLGAERKFDEEVRPVPGHLDYVRDARGRAMWVEASGYKAPERGQSVSLSFDLALQQIAEDEVRAGVEDADAAGGRLVMIDPRTGEVLAMVDIVRTVPGLSDPPRRGARAEIDHAIRYRTIRPDLGRSIHPALARNRCVEDVYEPGSTFKCFMWSVVTERGLAKVSEVFNTHDGEFRTAYGRAVRDVVKKPSMTWREVLVHSSNIGMVQGVERLAFNHARADILRFGFGSPTNLGLPGEASGLVTSARDWSKYTQTSVASGYEVAVTPLQMVRAFSAFAREGELAGTMPVLTLRAMTDAEQRAAVRERVLPEWVVLQAREAMRQVGENMDTRIAARFKDEEPLRHSMFGKSGTANIARPDGRGYFLNQYNSSFIAAAPAEAPRIVVLVVIDDPGPGPIARREHYGSWTAGPVVRRVVRRSLEYLGVPPDLADDAPLEAVAQR